MSLPQTACKHVSFLVHRDLSARLRLAKTPLCLLICFSAIFGYILAAPRLSLQLLDLAAGVLLLSAGAASLNSLQEWRQDKEMSRTRNRPLPRGELSPGQAARQAAVLICLGLLLLSASPSFLPPLTGAFALLLYNGIYTPLKRKTILAVFPGALCGGLPPLIGWFAGGGPVWSATVPLLIMLLVLWQIPHYWLVVLRHHGDYRNSRAPSMLSHLSEEGLRRVLLPWVSALAAAMLLFAALPPGVGNTARMLVVCTSGLLPAVFTAQLLFRPLRDDRLLFIFINLVFFFNMLVICGARMSLFPVPGR
jgi:protoheme IX farnesyltransferase